MAGATCDVSTWNCFLYGNDPAFHAGRVGKNGKNCSAEKKKLPTQMANFAEAYPTPLERQFTRFHNPDCHQYAHLHKNKAICLIGVSPSHPAVIEGIVSVRFGKAASTNEAAGKRKRGALGLRVDTPICTLMTREGNEFHISARVNCDLVEVNNRLDTDPCLVSSDPEMSGYLCIGIVRDIAANTDRCFPGFVKLSDVSKFVPAEDS